MARKNYANLLNVSILVIAIALVSGMVFVSNQNSTQGYVAAASCDVKGSCNIPVQWTSHTEDSMGGARADADLGCEADKAKVRAACQAQIDAVKAQCPPTQCIFKESDFSGETACVTDSCTHYKPDTKPSDSTPDGEICIYPVDPTGKISGPGVCNPTNGTRDGWTCHSADGTVMKTAACSPKVVAPPATPTSGTSTGGTPGTGKGGYN